VTVVPVAFLVLDADALMFFEHGQYAGLTAQTIPRAPSFAEAGDSHCSAVARPELTESGRGSEGHLVAGSLAFVLGVAPTQAMKIQPVLMGLEELLAAEHLSQEPPNQMLRVC
jgi:hypothetical protein